MGMEDFLLSSTIIGILAQRLVRVACPYCQVPATPDPAIQKELKLDGSKRTDVNIIEVKGCERCSYTGFWGRSGIFEFLEVNDTIQRLILDKKSLISLKRRLGRTG